MTKKKGQLVAYKALGGFAIGAAVMVAGSALVSVVTMPQLPQPDAVANAPENGTPTPVTDSDPVAPNLSEPVDPGAAPAVALAPADTDSTDDSVAADTSRSLPQAEVSADEPTLPSVTDALPEVTAEPNAPTAPVTGDRDAGLAEAAPQPDTAPETPIVTQPAAVPTPQTPTLSALPEVGSDPRPSSLPQVGGVDEPNTQTTATPQAPAAPVLGAEATAPQAATAAPAAPDRVPAQITPLPRRDTEAERAALPRVGQVREDEAPMIGKPGIRLIEEAVPEETPTADATPAAAPAAPLDAHSEQFTNLEAKPLMSIILIDQGDSPIGLDALSGFPFPITVALNPLSPTAQAAMRAYRDAGIEVMVLADIPTGATATDTETLLQAGLRELPQAIGVLEGTQTGLQSDKAVSDQASAILAETGHGLIMFPKGLNTAQKLALKNGVPSVSVFRDFDSKGQSASVIRRFLDQAAFKARQEEDGVVMVGRMRADTISALLVWGLQDRANRVALAPASAVLKATRP